MSLFSLPMVLVTRSPSGQVDQYNQPIYVDSRTSILGRWYQRSQEGKEDGGGVDGDTVKIGFAHQSGLQVSKGDYVEFDLEGVKVSWEIVGHPEPKFDPKGVKLRHWEVIGERAAA